MTELAAPQISSLMEALPGIAAVLRSPVASAMVDLVRAGVGLEEFRIADAEELLRFGIRRNLLDEEEVERVLAEVREAASSKGRKAAPAATATKAKQPPAEKKPAAKKPPAKAAAAKAKAKAKPKARKAAEKPKARPVAKKAAGKSKPKAKAAARKSTPKKKSAARKTAARKPTRKAAGKPSSRSRKR